MKYSSIFCGRFIVSLIGGGISKNVWGKFYWDVLFLIFCYIDVIVFNRYCFNIF